MSSPEFSIKHYAGHHVKEKINWKNIDYIDNKPCIDLISKKPNGIIHVLDDESSFPKVFIFEIVFILQSIWLIFFNF